MSELEDRGHVDWNAVHKTLGTPVNEVKQEIILYLGNKKRVDNEEYGEHPDADNQEISDSIDRAYGTVSNRKCELVESGILLQRESPPSCLLSDVYLRNEQSKVSSV